MKILYNDSTPGHSPKERKSKPTGGILNSLTLIPEYLASQGHEVYVCSTYQQNELINGVQYVKEGDTVPIVDVVVFNRNILPKEQVFYWKDRGAKVIWWLHDNFQLAYLQDDAYKYVDKIIALSKYCKDTYVYAYQIPEEMIEIIPNGVDKELFYPGTAEERNPNLVLMASALTKGFLPIPTVYENLYRHNPEIDFRVYSSNALHGLANTASEQKFLSNIEKMGAHVYPPASQQSLAILLRQARCLLMPNTYPEICSNLVLQAQASGCPVVTSDIGSASEFITNGVNGLMTTRYKPHDAFSWMVEYTNLVLTLYIDDKLFTKISTESPKHVKDWNEIGRSWKCLLIDLIKK